MLRELGAARNGTIAEARRVVVAHLLLVVSVVDIGQQHPLNGIPGIVKLAENARYDIGYAFVDNHLAYVNLIVIVPVQCPDMAQVATPDVRILLIGLSLHALPHAVRNRLGSEALLQPAVSLDFCLGHRLACLPFRQSGRSCRSVVDGRACATCHAAYQDGGKHPKKLCLHHLS